MIHFQEEKVSVPEDISVISLGGLEIGRYIYPHLTTIPLSAYEQGKKCAQILLDIIEEKKVPMHSKIKIKPVIEGGSVKRINI
ncbi:substrate-binding domain-containing protein [Eisenbergiella tayi]|uniref:substrate-binding domain-containing protein n=1 Tax=Eisenbergiella tayi TaxID=1432052 RepID=UPI00046FACB5|nr:substrate-binding domain-containing protein [Eisenbergiella tayi]